MHFVLLAGQVSVKEKEMEMQQLSNQGRLLSIANHVGSKILFTFSMSVLAERQPKVKDT